MKLATLRNGSRGGTLAVVSRDLSRYTDAADIAPTLQHALDHWDAVLPALLARFASLQDGRVAGRPFDPREAMAPLPRAYQWLDASAFLSHGALMQKAFAIAADRHPPEIPLIYQGASDDFLGPTDDVALPSEADGIDFEAEIGVILGDVAMGATPAEAASSIRLLTLINDVSLRAHAKREIDLGFGFLHAKPTSSFAPVAVTPDELGDAWRDGRVHLAMRVVWNGREVGRPNAAQMAFSFFDLAAYAARNRRLGAGTVLGSGTISNAEYAEVGSCCIAEIRAIELIETGTPQTAFMRFGDRIHMEMRDETNGSVFGAIDQCVVQTGANPSPRGSAPAARTGCLDAAMRALGTAVGAEHAIAGPDLATCGDPYAFVEAQACPAALVSPGSVEEVQAVLAVAREYRMPIWTNSMGRNLGYGGSAPRVAGGIVMRLSRMNRVLAVDTELGTAIVEPGVTFLDLYAHLRANGIPLMMSVPDIGWGSVIGNALERGFGYAALPEHAASQCGFEVVLADGRVVRTGMGALPDARAWPLYRGSYGPSVDGLFFQSNLGVVTKMGLWLTPRPAQIVACMVKVRHDSDLSLLIDTLRPLLLDGTIQSNAIVGNPTIIASMVSNRPSWHAGPGAMTPESVANMAQALGLGAWNARFAVYGPEPVAAARMAVIRQALASIPGLELVARQYPGDVAPESVHPADRAQLGIPSTDLVRMAGWRGGEPAHTDFSLVCPPTGRDALRQLELIRPRVETAGFDYAGGFTLFPRHAITLALVSFDRSNEIERAAASQLLPALIAAGGAAGYAPYRAHLAFMDQIAGLYAHNDHALGEVHRTLKDALDPLGILSPGKQGVWSGAR